MTEIPQRSILSGSPHAILPRRVLGKRYVEIAEPILRGTLWSINRTIVSDVYFFGEREGHAGVRNIFVFWEPMCASSD